MGAIKNAFEDQINTGSLGGDEDYGYDGWTNELEEQYWENESKEHMPPELEAQFWAEQPPYPFATDEDLAEINKRIQPKYSDMDVDNVLSILNDSFLIHMLREEFDKLYNVKNGYFE